MVTKNKKSIEKEVEIMLEDLSSQIKLLSETLFVVFDDLKKDIYEFRCDIRQFRADLNNILYQEVSDTELKEHRQLIANA